MFQLTVIKLKKYAKNDIKTDFLRTKKLSGDHVPLIDVFKFVVEKYKIWKVF